MNTHASDVALVLAVLAGLAAGAAVGLAHTGGSDDPADLAVVVTDGEGETLLAVPVEPGDSVVLAYTHSVEKTPVRDVYEVRESGLVLTRTEFQSYGAGLPSTADVTLENGTFVHEVPATDPGPLAVSPGEVAGHELVVGDERIDLVDRADGETVVLAVEPSRTGR